MTRVRVVKVERNRAAWRKRYLRKVGWSAIEWTGVEWSGVERSGTSKNELGMINKTNTCMCNGLISKSVVHLGRDYH